MFKFLVILYIIKLDARNNIFSMNFKSICCFFSGSLISNANQLAGFYMIQIFTVTSFLNKLLKKNKLL